MKGERREQDLFGSPAAACCETEGIKYAGSKLKLLPHILAIASGLPDVRTVLDGFSGTTRVAQALYQTGKYAVTANDISAWSEVFGRCYLLADKPKSFYQEYIDYLNALPGREGWFTAHYGGEEGDAKRPFQAKNTRRLDAIREEIDHLGLCSTDKAVLLTSLILALDAVDSTIGHYASYLARWSPRSYKDMTLRLPRLCHVDGREAHVQRGDIFGLVGNTAFDLAYFDPPYGSNNEKMPPSRVRYASYYHFWTSVVRNDRPALFGKAQRREDSRDTVAASVFEEFRKDADGKHLAMRALERLVRETRAHYVLLSYSSGGRATKEELLDILHTNGKLLKAVELDYRHNVMATMSWTREWLNADTDHKEYLLLLEKA